MQEAKSDHGRQSALERFRRINRLWHDYLRLRTALGASVTLFAPEDIAARFVALGNRKLIAEKPRNRALLEQLSGTAWPCHTSARIFDLIKETGSGLEQESLFLKTRL